VGGPAYQTRPVRSEELEALAQLFDRSRNTRRCWCMASYLSGPRFAVGWVAGSHRHRFEAMTGASAQPMGILAWAGSEPVGWCACGPQTRYLRSANAPSGLERQDTADPNIWLVPCFYVRSDHRGRGVMEVLLRAAVDEATAAGATAVEGWPASGPDSNAGNAFLGREDLFARLGFVCVERPGARRAVMRLELPATTGPG
jgi:GNAT superfamily N-acetyltransferase